MSTIDSTVIGIPPIEQFYDLIWQNVNYCWGRMCIPRPAKEDLFQEGGVAYARAAQRFDPDRGLKFITFFYWTLQNHLAGLLRKSHTLRWKARGLQMHDEEAFEDLQHQPTFDDYQDRISERFYYQVSRDAMKLIRCFLDPPSQFNKWASRTYPRDLKSPRRILHAAFRWLQWDRRRRANVLAELRQAMQDPQEPACTAV